MDAREPSVQGDKWDPPALWAGPGARPHPVLAAEPSSPLDASVQCCTLSGFWSPPARLIIRLSKEKAKKEKGREKERKKKKKSQPSHDAWVLSLQWGRTVSATALRPTGPTEGGDSELWRGCRGSGGARSVGSCLPALSGRHDHARLAWALSTCQQAFVFFVESTII